MSSSTSPAFDPELISIMLIFAVALGLFTSFGLIEGSTATLLFWLLSQGRIFTRFADLRRSKGRAWRYFLLNQLLLAILTILLAIVTKE